MAAPVVLGIALLGISASASAQPVPSPPGFSAPDSTQPIEAYRLPDWSYSILNVGGNGNTSGTRNSFERNDAADATARQFSGDLRLDGNYLHVWESEQRAARLAVTPNLDLGWSSTTEDDGASEEEQEGRFVGTALRTEGQYDRYVSDRTFLFTSGQLDVQYENTRTERSSSQTDRETTFRRTDLDWTVGAGLGFGRVRDVTPVVRALRVQERLRAVRPGASLSTNQIQSVAQQFAKLPGYTRVYDRPDKAFWGDLFNQVGRQAGDLSAFETYYVSEALVDRVGRRLDGWEVRLSPQLSRSYFDEEQTASMMPDESATEEQTFVQVRAEAAWYETVSLAHQVSATGSVTHSRELEGRDPLQRNWFARVQGSWLWVLADRFQLTTRLRPTYSTFSADDRPRRSSFGVDAGSNLSVFIEDRLILSARLNLRHDRRWREEPDVSETNTQFALRFGVQYVLSRVLP